MSMEEHGLRMLYLNWNSNAGIFHMCFWLENDLYVLICPYLTQLKNKAYFFQQT